MFQSFHKSKVGNGFEIKKFYFIFILEIFLYLSEMEKMHKDMLQFLANGKKQDDLTKLTGLTQNVVNIHMRMIRAELRAINTSHAIAIAMRQKLIK